METRTKLKPYYNQRKTYTGIFSHFGKKNSGKHRERLVLTLLIKDLRLKGQEEILTDHIWMNYTKQFVTLGIEPGHRLQFDARVDLYEKGYAEFDEENPKRLDYHLVFPTKITILEKVSGDYTFEIARSQEVMELVAQHEERRKEQIAQYLLENAEKAQAKEWTFEPDLTKPAQNKLISQHLIPHIEALETPQKKGVKVTRVKTLDMFFKHQKEKEKF